MSKTGAWTRSNAAEKKLRTSTRTNADAPIWFRTQGAGRTFVWGAFRVARPNSAWTAKSLALHTQAVLQGAFILAKAGGSAEIAVSSVDHLRRYIELLFQPRTGTQRDRQEQSLLGDGMTLPEAAQSSLSNT